MDYLPDRGAPESARRPTTYAQAVKEAACRNLLPAFQKWWGKKPGEDADDLALLVRCANENSYEFASSLDTFGCLSPDGELVELLGYYSVLVSEACRDATKAWVAENGITVPFVVEDRVSHVRLGVGRVSDIRHDEAIVVFRPDAEAHRFAGMEAGCGYLVAAELLKVAPDAEPSTTPPGAL